MFQKKSFMSLVVIKYIYYHNIICTIILLFLSPTHKRLDTL